MHFLPFNLVVHSGSLSYGSCHPMSLYFKVALTPLTFCLTVMSLFNSFIREPFSILMAFFASSASLALVMLCSFHLCSYIYVFEVRH